MLSIQSSKSYHYNSARCNLSFLSCGGLDWQRGDADSILLLSGGRELEGAGPSPLNSVSDSNMCPTENTLFYLASQYFCLCPCLRAFLYLFPFISVHFSLSLSSIFFLYTFFPFPTHFFSFFFSLLSSVLCPTLSCVRRQGLPGKARKDRQLRPCLSSSLRKADIGNDWIREAARHIDIGQSCLQWLHPAIVVLLREKQGRIPDICRS